MVEGFDSLPCRWNGKWPFVPLSAGTTWVHCERKYRTKDRKRYARVALHLLIYPFG